MLNPKKGFSLIELVIVILIVGILAAIGIPQLASSLEKSRGADARIGLTLIYRAELDYAGYRNGVYTNSIDDLTDVVLKDRYWDFTIDTPTPTIFTAIATRNSGPYTGRTITIDHLGNQAGNWEFI